ncbi:MAG: 16S rRNA (uracil(1498)-N(3))-methyltransferase [Xanthomonadales bacterium]|nr:16S rRNA (uracil(1498)-N(3))-methyltransferase [Xanthomonadales bacterium]
MRISRLFTDQPLEPGTEVTLDADSSRYATRVLRLRNGDAVVLFNGDGWDYAAELVVPKKDAVGIRVTARLPAVPESPLDLVLVQAVSRGERMDQSLQKATELGVAAVRPLWTERVEVRLDGARLDKRMAHWLGVLRAASAQSGRGRVPELHPPTDLASWLESPARGLRLALVPGADRALSALDPVGGPVSVLVGPEGGFSDAEWQACERAGVLGVSMGPRILRTETAGPAALAVLQSLFGDA